MFLYNPSNVIKNSLELSWSKNTNIDFNRYEIHCSIIESFEIGNATLLVKIEEQEITNYTVTNLSASTKYYFKVRVVESSLLYSDSNEVSAATLDAPPSIITLYFPAEITTYTVKLRWSMNDDKDFDKQLLV